MEQIAWLDAYNTGIPEIDNQHRQIVDFVNKLSAARRDRRAIGEVLDGLVVYSLSHFAFEESLMDEVAYPFAGAHRKIHEMFIKRVDGFQSRFKAGEDVSEEFYLLLKRWLIQHIQRDDMAYSTAVKAKLTQLVAEQPASAATGQPKGSWFARSIRQFFRF